MTFNTKYNEKEVLENEAKKEFDENSVIFIKNLFQKEFCKEVKNYILKKENEIISKYSFDKKGLVLDNIKNQKLIKYFEYPFSFDRTTFGKFSQSKIYKIAENLLQDNVYIFSMELHSRIALGTIIPPHQDNAYYGLEKGKALTFYVPLDEQNPLNGGLRYCSNPIKKEYEHTISEEKGFSLTMSDNKKINDLKKLDPYYKAGDCTVHHSRSVHYANNVPANVERGLVLRMSFYSVNDKQKSDHAKWYRNIVAQNRLVN